MQESPQLIGQKSTTELHKKACDLSQAFRLYKAFYHKENYYNYAKRYSINAEGGETMALNKVHKEFDCKQRNRK